MPDENDIISEIEDVGKEFGVELPADIKIDLLEGVIHQQLLSPGESVPDSIIRLSGLRRINEVYGRLKDSCDEANELIEEIHKKNPNLGEEESEIVDKIAARMMMYEEAILFFYLSQDLIETLSVQVLEKHLIQDEYQGSNATWDALDEGIRTAPREEILRRTGLIDGTVKGEMGEVRNTRNIIAHRTEERQLFDFGPEVLELADKALHVINELLIELDEEQFWSKE